MSKKSALPLLMLLFLVSFLPGCSGANPPELTLDDAAQSLGAEGQARMRAAQEEYRRRCQGALAFRSVPNIERPEPGGFADEEFRNLKWPDWVDDQTPKALILYSRTPELIQVRFNNRWMPLVEQTELRSTLAGYGRELVIKHQPDAAALASAQTLIVGCTQPQKQGWLAQQFYGGVDDARDTINDYALPKPHWYTRWYYTLAFDPLLNGFLLVSGLFGFSSLTLIIFPLALALCLDKKGVDLLTKLGLLPVIGLAYLGAKIKPEWVRPHAASIVSISVIVLSLAAKGFRQLLGLPSYAVLCIALLGRPEDILTAHNHLYSWIPALTLSHLPIQSSILGVVSPLAPAGWLVGFIYFIASSINHADKIYKAVQLYNTDDEQLERQFGVIGELVKEEREQSDEVLTNWLKQLWRIVLFSIVFALAPLALSLYFVVKAVSDAAWVIAPLIGAKLKITVPKVLRALPHAALLLVLIVAYSKLPTDLSVAAASQPVVPPTSKTMFSVGVVWVREKPARKARAVKQLKRGDSVEVVNDSDGWVEVRLAGGAVGYVPGSTLSAQQSATPNRNLARRVPKRRSARR